MGEKILSIRQYYDGPMGFRGALNCSPMMPRDASSRIRSVRGSYPVRDLGKRIIPIMMGEEGGGGKEFREYF